MINGRSLSVLLMLGSLAACATATDSNPAAGDVGGTDSGGGAPSGGAAESGSSFGGATSDGSGLSGSEPLGGSPSAGTPSGGTADPGAAGGNAGTSSGAASGSAGSAAASGAAGGTSTGPCANPKDVSQGNSGNLGTTDGACLRTLEPFNTVGCSNFDGRTLKVNGLAATCDVKTTFPAAIGGYNYFEISAGSLSYASINWYSS